jgi:transcription elongation factor SPT4
MNPKDSWVARWQRIGKGREPSDILYLVLICSKLDKFQQGVYAIRVYGRIPEDVEDDLERRGISYRPRDGSVQE